MAERRHILRLWNRGAASALVTLVRAQGSSYRKPGAQLLIGSHGEYAGSISGGCLEAEIVRKAAWLVREGAVVARYSTLFDDTAEIPFGLGCGGVVDLLIEPASTSECAAMVDALQASLDGEERIVVNWLPRSGQPLRRAVLRPAGQLLFLSTGLTPSQLDALGSDLASASDDSIYVQRLSSPLRLFVLGAGDDARPVAEMASLLGWRVAVADGRANLATRERFPKSDKVLVTDSASELGIEARDAVVIMTHSYEQDRGWLSSLLRSQAVPDYIGLLGASHRSSLLVSEVAALAGLSIAECCSRVWAPVGLDIGGDGAEAIALAVIAEVQAWRQNKLSASRRLTPERIAQHIAEADASRHLQRQCALGAA